MAHWHLRGALGAGPRAQLPSWSSPSVPHQPLTQLPAPTWFEHVSMLVIMLNCVTLGMFRPCEDVECLSERCSILKVGAWAGGGLGWPLAMNDPWGPPPHHPCPEPSVPLSSPPPTRPSTTSSSLSLRWRWSSRWLPWDCLGRSATWVTRGTGWTSSSSSQGTVPCHPQTSSAKPGLA